MTKRVPNIPLTLIVILLSVVMLQGCSKKNTFETESKEIDLGALKLIPWKIPEGVVEPIHIKSVKVVKKMDGPDEYYLFTGEAINTGDISAFGIDVVLQFYDKERDGSGSVAELADPYKLEPGETAKYTVKYYPPPGAAKPEYFDIHAIAAFFEK